MIKLDRLSWHWQQLQVEVALSVETQVRVSRNWRSTSDLPRGGRTGPPHSVWRPGPA